MHWTGTGMQWEAIGWHCDASDGTEAALGCTRIALGCIGMCLHGTEKVLGCTGMALRQWDGAGKHWYGTGCIGMC